MKKQLAILLFGCTACGTAFGATLDWWNHLTICQVNNTNCYGNITAGIDSSLETGWDIFGNCRGRKFICADALTNGGTNAVAMDRVDILHGNGINSDFDTDIYVPAENCYGARKTSQNGAMVSINGEYRRVWCDGILTGKVIRVTNGEVAIGAEPQCIDLMDDNYVATLNGNCYGKRYDPNKYAIDCDGNSPVIIVLNGAQYTPNINNFITPFVINARFSAMQTSASTQRAIHFPK